MPVFPRLLTTACREGMCGHSSTVLVSVLNFLSQVFISVLIGSGFISIQLLLNSYISTMPDSKTLLALANSMLVSMQAFVRAVSPIANGALFSLGVKEEQTQLRIFLTRSLPFDSLAVIGFVTCLLCAISFERRSSASASAT